MKKLISVIILALMLFASASPCSAAQFDCSDILSSAKSAVVIDGNSGEVIYAKDADRHMLIASTTKIMTAVVTIENSSMRDIVTVSPEAAGVEGSSAYLASGEKLTVRELLYCLMLSSGNDAAAALAIHIAGSIPAFAEMMNEKARELGLENTSYANPHGLDADNHYSTARDLASLTRYALGLHEFSEIVATKTATIGSRTLKNHNKLLWSVDGTVGVKTGYTKAAGRILVSAVQRDGAFIICVTLSDPDDWSEHTALYEQIFDHLHCERICTAGDVFGTIPVVSGTQSGVSAVFESGISVLCGDGDKIEAVTELPDFLYGGIKIGDCLGKITVYRNGEEYAETRLIASDSVPLDENSRLTLGGKIKRLFRISYKYGGFDYPAY